jgi:hypothetical protein
MVHSLVHLLLDRLQRSPHSVSACLSSQSEASEFVLAADVRKAEKRKRLRLTQSTFGTSFGSVSPKFDKTRLIGVQGQAEMFQPFAEVRKKRCGVSFVLKTGNIIVGVSDEDDFTTGFPASPPVCPKVKTVVEVDV